MASYAFEDEADFVIVGTGAGGATAARVLAGAGHSVVLIEEGAHVEAKDRPRELLEAMRTTFRDFGTQTTAGPTPLPILQGRLVGGSTAINSGIIWRMPEDVRQNWIKEWGLDWLVDEREMERIYAIIERELQVAYTSDEIRGGNCDRMAEACAKLGLPGKPMQRNAATCKGSAMCLQGCPNLARQSMDVSYIPRALNDGARLHAMSRVDRVLIDKRRATGVEGTTLDPVTRKPTGKFRVQARRAVIMSASVTFTPVILRKSGLRGLVGDRFQAHPGCAVLARFPDNVGMGWGATQGYEVPLRERRFKLETLSLPPEMLATRIPGAGARWQERLAQMDRYAQWAVQIRMEAHGTIRPSMFKSFEADYAPTRRDVLRAREGCALIARMMFEVGADEVYPGMACAPQTLTSIDQVRLIEEADPTQGDFHFMASHLFGTAVAGKESTASVVGPDLQSHEVRGLYVMDASVFPTNMGVNPQHSIMTVVYRAAEKLANDTRAVVAA